VLPNVYAGEVRLVAAAAPEVWLNANVWLAPLGALVGALVGGFLAPFTTARLAHVKSRREVFDRAIVQLQVSQLRRSNATSINPLEAGLDAKTAADLSMELDRDRFSQYVRAVNEARDALAAVSPYYTLKTWNPDDWGITEENATTLIRELREARDARTVRRRKLPGRR